MLTRLFFYFEGKNAIFFRKKMAAPPKKVIALNLYIGTNVLVYERWLALNVWYTAGRPAQYFSHYIVSLHIAYACESTITFSCCIRRRKTELPTKTIEHSVNIYD